MVELIRDRTAIAGIGQTRFGKGLEDTELSLACQAISAAIDDALHQQLKKEIDQVTLKSEF